MVKNIADLYKVTEDDLLQINGFARKSAHQLYQAIQSAKNPEFERFLYALGIRHVGEYTAHRLALYFDSFDAIRRAEYSELKRTPGVGTKVAKSITDFFQEKDNRNVLDELFKVGLKVRKSSRDRSSLPLEGKIYVFTGSLEKFNRSEAERVVESLGGRAVSSVSKNTDYVVVGDKPGSKLDEAKKYNTTILDEKEFEEMIS